MEEAEVPARQFIEPREDAAKVLDLTDETLDEMTLSVPVRIVCVRRSAVRARRDHRDSPGVNDCFAHVISVVGAVGDHLLALGASYECGSLRDIVLLSAGQRKAQGIAQTIDTHVDLCREPATTATKRLRRLPPLFWGAPAAE